MSDERFLSELEINYAFTFDVDQIIRAADFDKPTLFLCGRQDNCVGYKDLEKLLDDYRRASFAVLDGAGHNLQIEQNSLFQEIVRKWLERIEVIFNIIFIRVASTTLFYNFPNITKKIVEKFC